MNATSTLLIIVAILVAMVLGVLLAVTIYYASRQIKLRIDKLDEHLVILVETIENLDQSSTIELKALHDSLAEQQIVHKSIAKSSKIFNLVFKKPAVIVGASKKTIDNSKKRKKRNAKV